MKLDRKTLERVKKYSITVLLLTWGKAVYFEKKSETTDLKKTFADIENFDDNISCAFKAYI